MKHEERMELLAHVRAAPYCFTAAEDLCFNNYCDIGARVRTANQCRCVRGCGGTDGRTRPTVRRTGSHGMRTRGSKRNKEDSWMRETFEGDAPFTKMATSHSSTTEPRLLSPLCLLVVLWFAFASEQPDNTDQPFLLLSWDEDSQVDRVISIFF